MGLDFWTGGGFNDLGDDRFTRERPSKIPTQGHSQMGEEEKDSKLQLLTEMTRIGIEKLPYSYSSLKRFIDSETMSVHYNKHYKGYVKKLNDALSKKNYKDVDLEDIIKSISKYDTPGR